MSPTPPRYFPHVNSSTYEYNPGRKHKAFNQIFYVSGYDTSLPADCVRSALTTVFSSCGEIIYTSILPCCTFVCIRGEGALEKALELSGSDVGGWTVVVKREPTPTRNKASRQIFFVSGYDPSLPPDCVRSALSTVFSSCGEIIYTSILPSSTFVCISGEGALERALELNGSDVGGWTVVVKPKPTPNRNNQKEKDIIIGMPCPLCRMNDTNHFH